MGWFLTVRRQQRIALITGGKEAISKQTLKVVAGFVVSLPFGILLSVSFIRGYCDVPLLLLLLMLVLVLAALVSLCRAECVMGFALGMTFTFGAALPIIVDSIIAAAFATLHLFVYSNLMQLWSCARSS